MKKHISVSLAYTFLIVFLCASIDVSAQKFTKKKKYWMFGGSINTINYVGELDPGQSFVQSGTSLHKTRY